MPGSSLPVVEFVVRTIALTAVENEQRFCELDAVVGDGDFGYSLARGFEKVLESFDSLDRSNVGIFLKRVGMVLVSRAGGTSGPLWGTAFMRAGTAAGDRLELSAEDAIAMLRAAATGIIERGGAQLGDKTLLDALIPLIDCLEQNLIGSGAVGCGEGIARAAAAAERAAADTARLIAKRGRAAYTGERSIGSPDAGAVAVAVMAKHMCDAWQKNYA
jgi:dihydroxyacetone kinase phosphoprotein-dependent L subunit